MEHQECGELAKVMNLLRLMKVNHLSLQNQLKTLMANRQQLKDANTLAEGELIVSKADIQKLNKEIRMLKGMLSRMISKDMLPLFEEVTTLHRGLQESLQQLEFVKNEYEHWKSQWKNMTETVQKEKEEKLALACELQEVSKLLSQQSDFSATMGASCCTLLWRVTRCEDSIPTILVGTKVDEFLGIVSSTLESYLITYDEEPLPSDNSNEMQFVLALCGIITNIAATAYGRDFMMKHHQSGPLITSFIKVLSQEPCKKFSKLKNLILMAMYNLTINQKGLKYMLAKPDLLPLLTWQLQAENELDNRLHSICLLQSLLCEQSSVQVIHQVRELMHGSWLEELCCHYNQQLREAAKELRSTICMITSGQ